MNEQIDLFEGTEWAPAEQRRQYLLDRAIESLDKCLKDVEEAERLRREE